MVRDIGCALVRADVSRCLASGDDRGLQSARAVRKLKLRFQFREDAIEADETEGRRLLAEEVVKGAL